MRRLVLGLNAATVLLVLSGMAFLVIPFPLPSGKPPAVVSFAAGTTDDVTGPVADVGAGERVVRTNIFSPRRAAPTQRYAFGDPAPDATAPTDVVATTAESVMSDSADVSTTTDAVPHLYGTILGLSESAALLRLDASVSEPRLYRVGDRAGGYRVVEIADRAVTLMGRSGRVVLRLPRSEQ